MTSYSYVIDGQTLTVPLNRLCTSSAARGLADALSLVYGQICTLETMVPGGGPLIPPDGGGSLLYLGVVIPTLGSDPSNCGYLLGMQTQYGQWTQGPGGPAWRITALPPAPPPPPAPSDQASAIASVLGRNPAAVPSPIMDKLNEMDITLGKILGKFGA